MADSCNPVDCSLPSSSLHGIPGKNTGVGCQLLPPKKVSVKEINPLCIDIWFADIFSHPFPFVNYFLCAKLLQSCPNLCDPMDCSPSGSSVHGILQARILEWVVISSSWGSSQPRDQTRVTCIAGRFFTIWASREAPRFDTGAIIFQGTSNFLLQGLT